MTDALDPDALDALERRIDEWLAAIAAGWLPVEAIERATGDERRWYVRLRGEDKDFTTVSSGPTSRSASRTPCSCAASCPTTPSPRTSWTGSSARSSPPSSRRSRV